MADFEKSEEIPTLAAPTGRLTLLYDSDQISSVDIVRALEQILGITEFHIENESVDPGFTLFMIDADDMQPEISRVQPGDSPEEMYNRWLDETGTDYETTMGYQIYFANNKWQVDKVSSYMHEAGGEVP